jgi:hypothetical protein
LRTEFDIVGSFNEQTNFPIAGERTVNWYEFDDPKGKRPKVLNPTSGLLTKLNFSQFQTPTQAVRGSLVYKGNIYMVVGNGVYFINPNFIIDKIGTLTTFQGQVDIEANTFQVIFVDGVAGWIFDTNTTLFTQIIGNGFPAQPLGVAFLDGFFAVPQGQTNQWVISKLNDGTIWNNLPAGNIASITAHPGNITAIKTLHRRFFIFSDSFCEVWENAGQADFPFRRNNTLLMEFGTIAKASVVSAFDRLFFLSNAKDGFGHVMMVIGTEAIQVSPQSLDNQIQSYSRQSDATGMVYQDNGMVFYRLNFTLDNITWVFNVSQSSPQNLKWHNEEMLDGSRHLGQVAIYFLGNNYFGSYKAPILYQVSQNYLTNDGETIIRERITKQFFDKTNNRQRVDRIFLDMIQGEVPANSIPPGTDATPMMMLEISRDGGRTYGSVLSAPMGLIGKRIFRTIFRKLGCARTFTFRIRCYNAVKCVLLGATIDFELLPE